MKTFRCFLLKDENVLGYAVDRIKSDIPDPKINEKGELVSMGTNIAVQIGVLWDDIASPAPSYHLPNEIGHAYVPEIDLAEAHLQEYEEEDGEQEGEVTEEATS